MPILMLIVVFGLCFFTISFIIQFVDAIRNDTTFNGIAHMTLISACVTFLAFYFT